VGGGCVFLKKGGDLAGGTMRWQKEKNMTDQEIKCAILKYVYDEKKAGKVAMAVLGRIIGDYDVDTERVRSILKSLGKEGLLKDRVSGKVVYPTDKEITEKGIREYREKCSENKGD